MWGELVAILLALHSLQHQVADVERVPPDAVLMVPTQRLLIFGRSQEHDIMCLIELVHGVLEGGVRPLFVVGIHPRRAIFQVGGQNGPRAVHHKEWREPGGTARSCP